MCSMAMAMGGEAVPRLGHAKPSLSPPTSVARDGGQEAAVVLIAHAAASTQSVCVGAGVVRLRGLVQTQPRQARLLASGLEVGECKSALSELSNRQID